MISIINFIEHLHTKKVFLQLFFIFFIFLNIIDFLNIISGDLDFFKKLLSWSIIAYIFYKVSLTKIFIGERIKQYDVMLIISFSIFSVVKALVLYVKNSNLENYLIFKYFLIFISSLNYTALLNFSYLAGFIIIIIISLFLYLNYGAKRESFIGSFNLDNKSYGSILELLILVFTSLFFGVVIFNFFMEWFALAVDALILVIGLIYYLFLYIHNHTESRFSYLLRDISNTGNDFYKNLIMLFSNKKTVFIGISFLLTLHLLVDVGVYLVPYSIGTQNTLYMSSLDHIDNLNEENNRYHTPLFNFLDIKNSNLYLDFYNIQNDFLLGFGIILVYLTTLIVFFYLMIMPFYIFYKNISENKINFNSSISILFLSSLIFFFLISVAVPNITNPINIDLPKSLSVKGVDLHTDTVTNILIDNYLKTAVELLLSIILFATTSIFLLFRYEKYKIFFDKIIFVIIIIFFLYYIGLFFSSTLQVEYNSLVDKYSKNSKMNKDSLIFSDNKVYANELSSLYKNFDKNGIFLRDNQIKYKLGETDINVGFLSSSSLSDIAKGEIHEDYLIYSINTNKENDKISLKTDFPENIFIIDGVYDYKRNYFISSNFTIAFLLGENIFEFDEISRKFDSGVTKEDVQNYLVIETIKSDKISFAILFAEISRILLTSFFYIFGLLAFTIMYVRKNIFDKY